MRKKRTDIGNKLAMFSVLVLFALFVVPLVSAAPSVPSMYLYPENTIENCGGSTTVEVRVNTSDVTTGVQAWIWFDPTSVNITDVDYTGSPWQPLVPPGWTHWGDHIIIAPINFAGVASGDYLVATLTIECIGCDCISEFEFTEVRPDGTIPYNGTFTCGSAQAFTKDLPAGWNLISLPLTPTDNSTGTVLSGVSQNAVKQYNAVTKQFEDATVMDPGTGYFVHVTAAGTWEYTGTPESSTTTQLKSGLNMIGVPDCAMGVSAAMGSADYRYAARWNTTSQSYEVYNPNAPAAFHGFTTMEAGEGYFVSALSNGMLTVTCP